jgi:hypothetical protein
MTTASLILSILLGFDTNPNSFLRKLFLAQNDDGTVQKVPDSLPDEMELGPEISDEEAALIEKLQKTPEQIAEERVDKEAKEILREEGNLFDFQRVEISGIGSTDPGRFGKKWFDRPVHLSDVSDPYKDDITNPVQKTLDWVYKELRFVYDAKHSVQSTFNNELTEHDQEKLKALEGKSINEIYAHSWGTQAIYNAILAGVVSPPKKLVVSGVPEVDLEKWKLLADYTGTEVVFVYKTIDKIQNGGESLRLLLKKGMIRKTQRELKRAWEVSAKMNNFSSSNGDFRPIVFKTGKNYKKHEDVPGLVFGHNRNTDWAFLMSQGVLVEPIKKMRQNQYALIEEKKNELWDAAFEEAQNEIAEAQRLKDQIDAEREKRLKAEQEAERYRNIDKYHEECKIIGKAFGGEAALLCKRIPRVHVKSYYSDYIGKRVDNAYRLYIRDLKLESSIEFLRRVFRNSIRPAYDYLERERTDGTMDMAMACSSKLISDVLNKLKSELVYDPSRISLYPFENLLNDAMNYRLDNYPESDCIRLKKIITPSHQTEPSDDKPQRARPSEDPPKQTPISPPTPPPTPPLPDIDVPTLPDILNRL